MKQIINIPVMQLVLKEHILEHIIEQIVVLVPQMMEETTATANIIPQKRVRNRTVEKITDVMPLIQVEILEVIQLTPQESILERH